MVAIVGAKARLDYLFGTSLVQFRHRYHSRVHFFLYKGLRPSGKLVGGRQQRGSGRPMRGIVQYINLDQILLMDGMYRDRLGIFGPERNLNLIAHGRVIEVSSANFKNC